MLQAYSYAFSKLVSIPTTFRDGRAKDLQKRVAAPTSVLPTVYYSRVSGVMKELPPNGSRRRHRRSHGSGDLPQAGVKAPAPANPSDPQQLSAGDAIQSHSRAAPSQLQLQREKLQQQYLHSQLQRSMDKKLQVPNLPLAMQVHRCVSSAQPLAESLKFGLIDGTHSDSDDSDDSSDSRGDRVRSLPYPSTKCAAAQSILCTHSTPRIAAFCFFVLLGTVPQDGAHDFAAGGDDMSSRAAVPLLSHRFSVIIDGTAKKSGRRWSSAEQHTSRPGTADSTADAIRTGSVFGSGSLISAATLEQTIARRASLTSTGTAPASRAGSASLNDRTGAHVGCY